ncbi:hypothetical protein BDR03DRAFT_1016920, partial [Suillus americanus]
MAHVEDITGPLTVTVGLDEGILVFLLPAVLAPFQTSHSDANATLGSYVLLSTLSHKVSLSSAAMAAIIGAMATSAAPRGKWDTNAFTEELQGAVQFVGADKFVLPLLECLKPQLEEPATSPLYAAILSTVNTPQRLASLLIWLILAGKDNESVAASKTNAARALLSLIHQMISFSVVSIQSAVLAYVYDTHAEVLHVLYSSPELFLSTVTSTLPLDTIISQVVLDPPARAVLLAHLAFLVGHFRKMHPELSQAVQEYDPACSTSQCTYSCLDYNFTTSSLIDLPPEKKGIKDCYVTLMQNVCIVAVASGCSTPLQLSTYLIQVLKHVYGLDTIYGAES